jgi:hypothetical protein
MDLPAIAGHSAVCLTVQGGAKNKNTAAFTAACQIIHCISRMTRQQKTPLLYRKSLIIKEDIAAYEREKHAPPPFFLICLV